MKKAPLPLAFAALAFGVITAAQFRSVHKQPHAMAERREDLTRIVSEMERDKKSLVKETKELRDKLSQYEKESATGRELIEAIRSELEQTRMQSGLLAVKGPGVEVILQDSKQKPLSGEDPNLYVVHQEDILSVINEMNAGGAESIAINDQRIVANSSVRCVGPVVLVNATRIAPPYSIRAIGDADTLYASLTMPGGVIDTLKMIGLQVSVKKKKEVVLPSFSGSLSLKFAKPVPHS